MCIRDRFRRSRHTLLNRARPHRTMTSSAPITWPRKPACFPTHWSRSKYPPAEPEALRLLAPQRGLIATGEKQQQLQRHEAREATGFGKNEGTSGRYTPGILKV